MARPHVTAALATATIALLITFHLISTFGLPKLDYLRLHYVLEGARDAFTPQIPIESPSVKYGGPQDASLYMLGVGKADITGYV